MAGAVRREPPEVPGRMSATGVVYHLYGRDNELLYVGLTFGSGEMRLKQHRQRHSWADEVVRVKSSNPMPYDDLYRAEALAIQAGQPKYNVVGRNGETQGEWLVALNAARREGNQRRFRVEDIRRLERTGLAEAPAGDVA